MRKILLIFTALFFFSCGQNQNQSFSSSKELKEPDYDTLTRPQDDLYQFANGPWLKRTTIPVDETQWGIMEEIKKANDKIMYEELLRIAQDPNYLEGSNPRKASDFFLVGMDSLLTEKQGILPVKPFLNRIDHINTKIDYQDVLLMLGKAGFNHIFKISFLNAGADSLIRFEPGNLGLKDASLYFSWDKRATEVRAAYKQHMTKMLMLAGEGQAKAVAMAERIFVLESQLVAAAKEPNEIKLFAGDLVKISNGLAWENYLKESGVRGDSLNLHSKVFFKQVGDLLKNAAPADMKSFLMWCVLNQSAPYLHYAFVKESFDFNEKYLRGVARMQPRWRRVLDVTNQCLPDATGKLLTDKLNTDKAIIPVSEMAETIRLAFAGRIKKKEEWSDSLKIKYLRRLQKIKIRVGRPEVWKAYTDRAIEKGTSKSSYLQNISNAISYEQRNSVSAGRDNAKQWKVGVQTLSVYGDAQTLEIIIPGGILQPPLFNQEAAVVVNYGAIGSLIAEKMMMVLLADGNSPGIKTAPINFPWKYEAGAIEIAFEGLRRYYRENGHEPAIQGYTAGQMFFLSWAKARAVKQRIPQENFNAILSNTHAFQEIFQVKEGDRMYKNEKDHVRIW